MSVDAVATSPMITRRGVPFSRQGLIATLITYVLVVLAVVVLGFPLYWMLLGSFKTANELYTAPEALWPRAWTLQNYRDLFVQTNFIKYFWNSLVVSGVSTFLALVLGGIGAYSLSRFSFWLLTLIAWAMLICYVLPDVLMVLPLYVYVVRLGLADTLTSLIIANTAYTLPMTLWFMRAQFNAIPVSLEESAMIDGCSRIQAMYRVTLPLALPGLISVGVFSFIHAWNEFLFALVFTSSEDKKILALGLSAWIREDSVYSWGMLLAAAVLVTIPVLLFYLLVQRKLVVGLAEGASKGE